MLYTRKGDTGTTKTFGCDQRISKSSAIAEALGALDEINSYLGSCKIKAKGSYIALSGIPADEIIEAVQQNLFIIQAEVAGATKTVGGEKVREAEALIDWTEKELPPITTFFVSGGTELAATFDFARTIARRAERRVVEVSETGDRAIGEVTLAYLNRLSSLLYALARYANHKDGIEEQAPNYQ